MSTSKWKKRWLYDSKVEIPKTTKWRRSREFIEPSVDDDIRLRDVRQDLSSETIDMAIDLGNNTSPFKNQRILGDFLSSTQTKALLSGICLSERKCISVELDSQTVNVTADQECGHVDALDDASNKQTEMNELFDCEGIDETQINERPVEFCHRSSMNEEVVLNPSAWQNMSCDSELDGDCFENYPNEEDNELCPLNGGSLIENLTASVDIPDMDSFREISASSQEEIAGGDQPLYEDSSLSVSESSLLVMAFAVRHKLSGVALEDLLELIHLHCPKPNKCITEMKEFQFFFQALKHPIVKHYYCPNAVCKVYIGSSEPDSGTKCAVCATTLCCSAYFIEIPVMEQLKTILSRPGMIEKLQYRFRRVKVDPEAIEDVYDGQLYKQHSCPGGFLSDPNNISFLGNTDGVALIKSTSYGVWPVYLIVNEIPPTERFRRSNRIFAGLWFGKGKPHFPTFLRPFSLAMRELYYKGVEITNYMNIKAMFLDMSVDAPARAMWQAIKQFNGYCGCGRCKETGKHLDLGPGKKNCRRRCHVYPFNKAFAATTGHAGLRNHDEVKEQALEALRQRSQGKKDFAVEGVVGLSWGFGLPMYDVIRGTVVDYMHCVCEGVIDQLISQWLNKSNSKQGFYLGSNVDAISKELKAVTPTCEITRTPRSLADVKDWKASEKRAFLLYYAVPLLSSYLPCDHLFFLMMLTGGLFRLLKQSISRTELQEACTYLKLFTAQAPILYGNQFQTFNVHQLLHLPEVVHDLGPLWSNSCFPFEDYNGDLRDLFHGTKNVDGQIVTAVSVIQKLPEIARATTTSAEVMAFYEHLTSKRYVCSQKESISETVHVIGSLERVWKNSSLLTDEQLATLPRHYGKIWMFRRCLIDGVVFHSKSYKRVVARNDYTVEFHHLNSSYYGSIHTYVKVEEKCLKAKCSDQKCSCDLICHHFAIIEVLERDHKQLPEYRGRAVVKHITRVKNSNRLIAVPVVYISRKYLKVDVSSGTFICSLPNPYEKD